MPKPLTDALVRASKPPERGQLTITDSSLRNFALRLSQGGAKTFVVLLGKGKRHTIGHYPTISLSEARSAAKRILAERELGQIHPDRVAFDDALADFLTDCSKRLRPRTLKNYADYLRLLPFGRRPVASITPREIIRILDAQSQSQREHLHRVARTFFRWCTAQHFLDRSPLHALPLPAGKPRQRVLSEGELRAVWNAARAGTTPFHAIVALLILTGQRRGEIAALQWDWIKGDTINFPAHSTKNGREHTIPIGLEAQARFRGVTKMGSPYVFPALRQRSERTTVMNGWSKAKGAFDRECGVTGWTLHDLRRTYSTIHAKLGTPQIVVEKLLNHVSGGTLSPIAAVYNVHRYEREMREAVLTFEHWLTKLPDGPRG
jgi:integrase